MMTRLLIVVGHEMIRYGLAKLVEGTDIHIVAEAESAVEALELAREHAPDVVLLDIRLADRNGTKALERMKWESPERPLLILSVDDGLENWCRARALGAAGYLSVDCSRDDLLQAVRKMASGGSAWTDEQMRRFTAQPVTHPSNVGEEVGLTERQSEVLRCMVFGLTTKEIATALHIRYDTAKEHVQNTMRKIGVTGRTQAAVWAVRNGLVE